MARCASVNACPATTATLYVGSLASGYEPYGTVEVRFTDVATGRHTLIEATGTLPAIECAMDVSFPAGHVHHIEVLDAGGYPLRFHVYEWDTTADARDLTTDAYDSASVRFVRQVDDAGNVLTYDESWVTLSR